MSNLHDDTCCRWPVYPTVPGYNFVDGMSSSSLNPYFICSVQLHASLFVYLSVGGLNSASASQLWQMTQATGGTRHGVKLDKRLVMCVALSLEFLNISIDTSIQMLSEYDIHVYSFCGQAIQSLVGATFKYCVLIRFITISISMSHSRTSSVYTGVAVSAAPSDIGHHMSGSMYSRGRGPSAACGNRIKVFPLWSGQKE